MGLGSTVCLVLGVHDLGVCALIVLCFPVIDIADSATAFMQKIMVASPPQKNVD